MHKHFPFVNIRRFGDWDLFPQIVEFLFLFFSPSSSPLCERPNVYHVPLSILENPIGEFEIPPYVRVMANYLIRKQRRDISFFFQILWLISNLWNRFNSKFCWQHGRIEIFLPEEYSPLLTILPLSKQRRFHRASEKRINDANTIVVMVYRKINFIYPITIQH